MNSIKEIFVENGYIYMSEAKNRMDFNRGYTNAKGQFISECTEKAIEKYKNRY